MSMAPPGASPAAINTHTAMPAGLAPAGSFRAHQVLLQQGQPPPPHIKPTAVLAGKPTLIEWGKLRFLIMDAPRVRNG